MPSSHPPSVSPRSQHGVPVPHSGSTWRVRCSKWHRVPRCSNDGRHPWYRRVGPWGPLAGGRAAHRAGRAHARRPGQRACVPESSAAQTGPRPKRCGTRVRRTPWWYRWRHRSGRPKPNKPVTKGNKALMVSKTREMKEFSDHTFHPLGCQRHQGPIIYCLYTRLSRSKMKENELFSFIWTDPGMLIAPGNTLVGFRPR
jgi:hypothetical protein